MFEYISRNFFPLFCTSCSETKKKSIASTLRKRFGRGKDSTRAQSVERIPAASHDSNLLRPPQSLDSAASTSRIPG